MNLHDAKMRECLLPVLQALQPQAMLVQEWSIPDAIVDVGLITDACISGYEIKSAADSVTRLARQAPAYSRCFDRCVLVTAPNHVKHALKTLPAWWGIWIVHAGPLRVERPSQANPAPRSAELLWSTELSRLMTSLGLRDAARARQHEIDAEWGFHANCDGRCKRRPTKRAMMDVVPPGNDQVRAYVAAALRTRPDWRLPNGRSARNY